MNTASRMPLRCWAEIDLAALERNLTAIKNALPSGISYIAVVKADAYGHGIQQTVARLMHAGIDMFAVANVAEAATIREIGSGWPILILSPTLDEEEDYLIEYDLIATVSSMEEIDRLESKARDAGKRLKIHLKIDTGMGRVGVWHETGPELLLAAQQADSLDLHGVYTHFAAAEADLAFTDLQRQRFTTAIESLPTSIANDLLIHADNSAGLNSFASAGVYNAVRVGLMQFGSAPYPDSLLGRLPVESIFGFKAKIGLVKELPSGVDISYGRTCTLSRDSKVAIICAGYGDGVPRTLSNRGHALISGTPCPILGKVTMDQTIVDVTDLAQTPHSGDEACFIGTQGDSAITLEQFSEWAETIPWEILCSITKRVPRLYHTSIATQ